MEQQRNPQYERRLSFLLIAAFIIAVLSAGGGMLYFLHRTAAPPPSVSLYPGEITIGYVSWPGYLGLYIAEEKGYFKDAGLKVVLKNYPSFAEEYADYTSGKIQGAATLTIDAVNEAYKGLDHKIVLAIDHSNGADGIIAARGIKNLAALKGKRVAFEHGGTLEEFFLAHALEQFNLSVKDIVPIDLNAERSAQALVDGAIDAAVTYEPFMGQALQKSGGNKIYSSAEAHGLITDVLTFHTDFIRKHPESIQALLTAYFKALQFWKEHPAESDAIIAAYLGTTPEQVHPQVSGVMLLDERDNRTSFTFAPGLDSLYGNLRGIGLFMADRQQTNDQKKINTDTLIEPRFIRKAVW